MKTLEFSKKIKAIALTIALAGIYSAGVASYPTLHRTYIFASDLFTPSQASYTRSLSEEESRTLQLFNSPAFQATCKHGANSLIALEMAEEKKNEARELLNKFERESILASFDMSSTEALRRASSTSSKNK